MAPFAIPSQTQHFRPNNETYAGDFFIISGQSAGPSIVYFYFIFIFINFSPDTAAEPGFVTTAALCSTSHTLSFAGRRSQQQAFNEPGPRPSFHRSKPHSLPASAPQPSPRLSQLQRKYAAGPLASISRC